MVHCGSRTGLTRGAASIGRPLQVRLGGTAGCCHCPGLVCESSGAAQSASRQKRPAPSSPAGTNCSADRTVRYGRLPRRRSAGLVELQIRRHCGVDRCRYPRRARWGITGSRLPEAKSRNYLQCPTVQSTNSPIIVKDGNRPAIGIETPWIRPMFLPGVTT
jgi:hypothetical protein